MTTLLNMTSNAPDISKICSVPSEPPIKPDTKLNSKISEANFIFSEAKTLKSINLGASKEEEIMAGLIIFFGQEYNLNQMIPVICGTSAISLRALDWFVTNYAKHYNIMYSIKKRANTRQFSVFNNYKSQLKNHSKKLFDPFCRRGRIFFEYAPDEGIETTVGQLNFFRWAIENKVLDWVENHLEEIVDDMNTRTQKPTVGKAAKAAKAAKLKTPQPVLVKKKRELSVAANKSISQHDVKITLKFDL